MKICKLLAAAAACAAFGFVILGCNSGTDTSGAPTKAEIDQGLAGKPQIDPNLGAPMRPGGGKGGGAAPTGK